MKLKAVLATAVAFAFVGTGQAHAGLGQLVNSTGDDSDTNLGDFLCDTSADAGNQCTFRAAIEQANATLGTDVINFNIPGSGVRTIAPESPLPEITPAVQINGYTQPGAAANTRPFGKSLDTKIRIFIDGSAAGNSAGLRFGAGSGNSEVRGLAIGNFDNPAISVGASEPIYVQGNFLGTNAPGTKIRPVSSGFFGLGGSGSVIGGGAPADRNLIAGAETGAIVSNGFVTIEGNYIGTESDGRSPLTNGAGINLADPDDGSVVVENVIAHTAGNAVTTLNNDPGTLISFNRIFDNAGLGIDLGSDGVTPNDDDESDGRQNYPVVKKAKRVAGGTKLSGNLQSLPSTQYFLEFFQADGKDREGKRLIGTELVTTDAEGAGSFNLTPSKRLKKGRRVTATATNPLVGPSGDTSEFAKPRKVK